jgi:hypothetical protein
MTSVTSVTGVRLIIICGQPLCDRNIDPKDNRWIVMGLSLQLSLVLISRAFCYVTFTKETMLNFPVLIQVFSFAM